MKKKWDFLKKEGEALNKNEGLSILCQILSNTPKLYLLDSDDQLDFKLDKSTKDFIISNFWR